MKPARVVKFFIVTMSVVLLTATFGCAPHIARPDQMVAPEPIYGNTGKFMSAYTSDDVLAEWVDCAIKAKDASSIGGAAGAFAGQEALKQIPFVGGILGDAVGKKIGLEIAIKAAGGWDHIRQTSDLSFNSPDNLAVYLYVKHSRDEHYQDALNAEFSIYPDFKQEYSDALIKASRGIK